MGQITHTCYSPETPYLVVVICPLSDFPEVQESLYFPTRGEAEGFCSTINQDYGIRALVIHVTGEDIEAEKRIW